MTHKYIKFRRYQPYFITSLNIQAAQDGTTTRYTILTPKPRSSASSTSVPAMRGVLQFLRTIDPRSSRNRLPTGSSLPRMMRKANLKASACRIWRFNLGAGSEEQGEASQIQPGTKPNAFSMLTAPTTGANRRDSASS